MENTEKQVVEMTTEQLEQFKLFQEQQKIAFQNEKRFKDIEAYKELVDDAIRASAAELICASKQLIEVKQQVLDRFNKAIDIKGELYGLKRLEQYSHTFTDSETENRITIGQYVIDAYDDTVNEGIAIVREAISGMVTDDKSKALVNTIMKLLSKDKKNNLKASRVMQLQQTAEELGNERIKEGVDIIRKAYKPAMSKTYIRFECKQADSSWKNVPLGITEA